KMRKPDSEPVPSSSRNRKSTVAAGASHSDDKATTDDGDESPAGGRSSMQGPGIRLPEPSTDSQIPPSILFPLPDPGLRPSQTLAQLFSFRNHTLQLLFTTGDPQLCSPRATQGSGWGKEEAGSPEREYPRLTEVDNQHEYERLVYHIYISINRIEQDPFIAMAVVYIYEDQELDFALETFLDSNE
ncbi:hypothetical protein F5880DRAFT_1512898, partial [Lentinula raphanica]